MANKPLLRDGKLVVKDSQLDKDKLTMGDQARLNDALKKNNAGKKLRLEDLDVVMKAMRK